MITIWRVQEKYAQCASCYCWPRARVVSQVRISNLCRIKRERIVRLYRISTLHQKCLQLKGKTLFEFPFVYRWSRWVECWKGLVAIFFCLSVVKCIENEKDWLRLLDYRCATRVTRFEREDLAQLPVEATRWLVYWFVKLLWLWTDLVVNILQLECKEFHFNIDNQHKYRVLARSNTVLWEVIGLLSFQSGEKTEMKVNGYQMEKERENGERNFLVVTDDVTLNAVSFTYRE